MKNYKYTSAEIAFKIVKNNELRFTQPKSLNDAFELQPIFTNEFKIDYLKKLFKELLRNGTAQNILEDLISKGYSGSDDSTKTWYDKDDFKNITAMILKYKLGKEKKTLSEFVVDKLFENKEEFRNNLVGVSGIN